MTINVSGDWVYPAFGFAAGLVIAGLVVRALLRRVHALVLVGAMLIFAGVGLTSFSLYAQRPSAARNPTPAQAREYDAELAAWEAMSDAQRNWLRPAWPVFLVLTVAGIALIGVSLELPPNRRSGQ